VIVTSAETLLLTDRLDPKDLVTIAKSAGGLAALARAAPGLPSFVFDASQRWLAGALSETLEIPVGEWFKSACLELAATADGQAPAPGAESEPEWLTLASFVIESEHHPTIAVTCAAVSALLRLDVKVSLEVSGAQLHLDAGRVSGARTGSAMGKVQISCLGLQPPVELGTAEFSLPGELSF
jgi:hypothetical protein